MMKDGDDCLYSVQLYRAPGDVIELPRIFLFLKARNVRNVRTDLGFSGSLSFSLSGLLEMTVREPFSIC